MISYVIYAFKIKILSSVISSLYISLPFLNNYNIYKYTCIIYRYFILPQRIYCTRARIWNQLARFKTSLKVLCLHFQRKCEERKQSLNCVRWRIDFAKVEVEELFRARESRKRKQDLSYACPSVRILPWKGRRRIFDLASYWKSTSVGVRPHLGAQSRGISDLLCVLLQSKKRYKYADPQDVRFSDL